MKDERLDRKEINSVSERVSVKGSAEGSGECRVESVV